MTSYKFEILMAFIIRGVNKKSRAYFSYSRRCSELILNTKALIGWNEHMFLAQIISVLFLCGKNFKQNLIIMGSSDHFNNRIK